jgi:hypothetical protein
VIDRDVMNAFRVGCVGRLALGAGKAQLAAPFGNEKPTRTMRVGYRVMMI